MNIGFIVCICCCLLFLIFALIFTILKDKAAILISGFNSMSKDQREMYDQKKMSKDQRNAFLIWGLIFAVGAILANFISQFFAIIAFIVWLIIFFKGASTSFAFKVISSFIVNRLLLLQLNRQHSYFLLNM